MSTTNFQIPSFAQFQQGAPQAPPPSMFNPSSGGGVPSAAQASNPGGGGSPQYPQPNPQGFPQPNPQGLPVQQGFPTPNFQQQPTNQPPTQPAWASPLPNTAPVQQPEVSPYILELERLGKLPPGQFRTDRELAERLYLLSGELAGQVDEYENRFKATPQPSPAPTTQPTAPPTQNVATAADVAQMAAVFQQNGMLAVQNGQWVAVNPMATGVAEQMNRSVMEAQARQAELANPSAFIQKYGADVISQQLSPLKQQLEEMTRQNQLLQQQFQNSVPRPDRDWIAQNRDKLYTKDVSGREVETPVGAIYRTAWNAAAEQGKTSYADIHQYALGIAAPLLGTPAQLQQPKLPWMATVQNPQSNMYAADPSFTAPGTIFNNGVSPQHQGRPLDNTGFPSFAALQAQGIQ